MPTFLQWRVQWRLPIAEFALFDGCLLQDVDQVIVLRLLVLNRFRSLPDEVIHSHWSYLALTWVDWIRVQTLPHALVLVLRCTWWMHNWLLLGHNCIEKFVFRQMSDMSLYSLSGLVILDPCHVGIDLLDHLIHWLFVLNSLCWLLFFSPQLVCRYVSCELPLDRHVLNVIDALLSMSFFSGLQQGRPYVFILPLLGGTFHLVDGWHHQIYLALLFVMSSRQAESSAGNQFLSLDNLLKTSLRVTSLLSWWKLSFTVSMGSSEEIVKHT